MRREDAFLLEIESLNNLLSKFKKNLSTNSASAHLEQQKKYKILQKELEKALYKQFSENALLEDDDWRTLLEQSILTSETKEVVINVLETNKSYEHPKDFVQMVEQFYKHRYSNHQKYLGKLDLGIEISTEQYQGYLDQAITYTLKQKGTTTKAVDLSANLIMLLKGRIKTEDENKGTVLSRLIDGPQLNSSQLNLSFDSEDVKLPKLTQKLNALPLIKRWKFGVEDSVLSFSATAIGAYKENKAAQINLGKIGDNFSAAMDLFTTDINASLTKADFGGAVAVGDTKVSIGLGSLGTFELGVKIADFSISIKEGTSFTPIQVYGKLEISFEQHKKWFEQYEELMKLTTFKVEFVVNIATNIGLKPNVSLNKNVQSTVEKILKAQEEIVKNKQTEYLKKQEVYNDLIEKKEDISKIQKENKYLDKLIENEHNPAKKKKLLVQRGKRKIKILKEYQAMTKRLEKEGAGTLANLRDQVVQKSKEVDAVIKKTVQKYDQVIDKITKPAYKLMAELLQKQASKRMVSLLMKAVPGLNVISLAVDIYDAYTLVSDISAAYMDADTEMVIDEEMEQIANSDVNIEDMPKIVPFFLTGIGAGGKLITLKPKDVEELQQFLEEHFPEGDESTDFINFMFNYGDYYDKNKTTILDNEQLIKSLKGYNLETVAHEGEVVDLDASSFNEGEEEVKSSSFFRDAGYIIIGRHPQKVGDEIELDALGFDYDDTGKKHQISFPDNQRLNLVVTSIPDDETIKLETTAEFVLSVEGFTKGKRKKYQLKKGSKFVYNTNSRKIIRK